MFVVILVQKYFQVFEKAFFTSHILIWLEKRQLIQIGQTKMLMILNLQYLKTKHDYVKTKHDYLI